MPVCDGLEATRRIRLADKLAKRRPPYILGLTAHAGDSGRDKCIAAGMDAFLCECPSLFLPIAAY